MNHKGRELSIGKKNIRLKLNKNVERNIVVTYPNTNNVNYG